MFPSRNFTPAWCERIKSTVSLVDRDLIAALWRARFLPLTVSAMLLVLWLPGCGSTRTTFRTGRVEHAIADSILTQHHLRATVRCPTVVPRRAGFVFTCTARLSVGTYPVVATETNRRGHVSFRNTAPLLTLDVAAVERAITRSIVSQRHLRSTVSCPEEVLQMAGITFTCTATVNGRHYPFSVTEVDGDGHVRYVEGR